jgi:bifunctional non-homologous end joining protein LigD
MATRRYGRHSVETSNEDKVLFPDAGLTKGDLIDHYERAWEWMRPFLRDRPLVMQRFPDGIDEEGFYQKQVGEHFPDWIDTVRVAKEGGEQELVVCRRKATLAYLANQACITPHLWLSRTDRLDHPDQLVVDLDPPGRDFEPVRRTALRCRDLLEELGLVPFVKTTGSKGLHVVVPLDRSEDFDSVRAFARAAMTLLAARHPDELTLEQRRNKRRGRLYLDVGRNAYAQTAVAPYAVRALPGAPVATPLDWDELGRRDLDARSYTVANLARRTSRRRDPWSGLRRRARSLGAPRRRLRELEEAESRR